eukprot:801102-Pleurochrysis_carterae.AAC.3
MQPEQCKHWSTRAAFRGTPCKEVAVTLLFVYYVLREICVYYGLMSRVLAQSVRFGVPEVEALKVSSEVLCCSVSAAERVSDVCYAHATNNFVTGYAGLAECGKGFEQN